MSEMAEAPTATTSLAACTEYPRQLRVSVLQHGRGRLDALVAADGLLHVAVEVLHAHREPVEAERAQERELLEARDLGVHLDRDLGGGQHGEVAGDGAPEPRELAFVEVG